MSEHKFNPDYRVAPGATIIECLPFRGVKMAEAPARLRMSAPRFLALLDGDYPLTENVAQAIEELTSVPKQFWLNREAAYRKPAAPSPEVQRGE